MRSETPRGGGQARRAAAAGRGLRRPDGNGQGVSTGRESSIAPDGPFTRGGPFRANDSAPVDPRKTGRVAGAKRGGMSARGGARAEAVKWSAVAREARDRSHGAR